MEAHAVGPVELEHAQREQVAAQAIDGRAIGLHPHRVELPRQVAEDVVHRGEAALGRLGHDLLEVHQRPLPPRREDRLHAAAAEDELVRLPGARAAEPVDVARGRRQRIRGPVGDVDRSGASVTTSDMARRLAVSPSTVDGVEADGERLSGGTRSRTRPPDSLRTCSRSSGKASTKSLNEANPKRVSSNEGSSRRITIFSVALGTRSSPRARRAERRARRSRPRTSVRSSARAIGADSSMS